MNLEKDFLQEILGNGLIRHAFTDEAVKWSMEVFPDMFCCQCHVLPLSIILFLVEEDGIVPKRMHPVLY
jgi:hypothetical protein